MLGADQKKKKKRKKLEKTQSIIKALNYNLLPMLMPDANIYQGPTLSRPWSKGFMHASLCYSQQPPAHPRLLHLRWQLSHASCQEPKWTPFHAHPHSQEIPLALLSLAIQNTATSHHLNCDHCSQSYMVSHPVNNRLPSRYPWVLFSTPLQSDGPKAQVHQCQSSVQSLPGSPCQHKHKVLTGLTSSPSPPCSLLWPHHRLLPHSQQSPNLSLGLWTIPLTAPSLWNSCPRIIHFAGISPHGR